MLPAALCLVGYFFRTIRKVKEDKTRREEYDEWYVPQETVGTILGRIIVSLIPTVNIMALVLDLSQEVFEKVVPFIKRFVNIPLIRKKAN